MNEFKSKEQSFGSLERKECESAFDDPFSGLLIEENHADLSGFSRWASQLGLNLLNFKMRPKGLLPSQDSQFVYC